MFEWKANNYSKTNSTPKENSPLVLCNGGMALCFNAWWESSKVNSAVDKFKRCPFILFDSIISSEGKMSYMDGFQSREARNFTSTVCTQPEQHMPYDLPVDESKHLKAYAVRNRFRFT